MLCYDNINISMSIFVEQRSGAPAKVQSGTFPILYEIRNPNPEHMRLAPTLLRAKQASSTLTSVRHSSKKRHSVTNFVFMSSRFSSRVTEHSTTIRTARTPCSSTNLGGNSQPVPEPNNILFVPQPLMKALFLETSLSSMIYTSVNLR
jgi:hypothetical protein